MAESPERFHVTLDDAQGPAALGTRDATVDIAGTTEPAGRLEFGLSDATTAEGPIAISVQVYRSFYAIGPVSVTVTPVSGTATAGSDFAPDPITVSWGDQDFDVKLVTIPIVNDGDREQTEEFTLQLTNATGGAFIGPNSTMAISIRDNDSQGQSNGSGGGGALGFLSVLLLGAARFLRSLIRPGDRHHASS
jgi:hypothetical protein